MDIRNHSINTIRKLLGLKSPSKIWTDAMKSAQEEIDSVLDKNAKAFRKEFGLAHEAFRKDVTNGMVKSWMKRSDKPQVAREILLENLNGEVLLNDIYVVTFTYILGGWKAMLSTTVENGEYYEITFDVENERFYVDTYVKRAQRIFETRENREARQASKLAHPANSEKFIPKPICATCKYPIGHLGHIMECHDNAN